MPGCLAYECSNGVDDDDDGDIDLDDAGCTSSTDNDETDCGDGVCETGIEICDVCALDCGACIATACSSGADSNEDLVVDSSELVDFITSWKSGTISISQLISAIGEWKNGCA